MVPLQAIVAVPKLQLSASWVDFGTCFVNERRVRDIYLMNLSGCRSYWAVLMGRSCSPACPLLLWSKTSVLVPPPRNSCRDGQVPRAAHLRCQVGEGFLGQLMEPQAPCAPFPSLQVSRSQTRMLWSSGSPRAVGSWRHDQSMHPQPPSCSRFSSLPGTALPLPWHCPEAHRPRPGS